MTSNNKSVPILTKEHFYVIHAELLETAVSFCKDKLLDRHKAGDGLLSLFTTCPAHAQLQGREHGAFQCRGEIKL